MKNDKMEHQISICMGSSCFARGNDDNLELIETFIEKMGENITVELSGSRCEGECCKGPNIRIDGILYQEVDKGSLLDLLHKHLKEPARGDE